MKFMLIMNAPRGTGDYAVLKWAPDDIKAHIRFMHRFNQELRDAGEFVAGEGLAPPSQARIVRAGKHGEPEVTDGPFAESKEFLVGWWIVDVESQKRACELAARVSAAPGPGGVPINMPIELREVPPGPPSDL